MPGTPRVEQALIPLVTWCPDVRTNGTLSGADEKKGAAVNQPSQDLKTSKPVILQGPEPLRGPHGPLPFLP